MVIMIFAIFRWFEDIQDIALEFPHLTFKKNLMECNINKKYKLFDGI